MVGIRIQAYEVGKDVVFLVTGGEAHIGAMATAWATPDTPTVQSCALALPGHREAEIAVELAEMASRTLNRTVAVVAGIHLESPTKEEIKAIVELARSRMRGTLEQWSIKAKE